MENEIVPAIAAKASWVSPRLINLGDTADVLTNLGGSSDGEGANSATNLS